jgi:WD40 repeat protein
MISGQLTEIKLSRPMNTRKEEALAALSLDGRWLALSHGDGTISIWNVEAVRMQCAVRAPSLQKIESMVFADDGSKLVFVCGDEVCLHDTKTGELYARFRHHHRDFIISLAYSNAARLLALGSFDDTASVWEIGEAPVQRVVLRGHRASIRGIHFLDDARYVLTVGGEHCAKLWDAHTGRMRLTLHNASLASTAASEGRTLATLGRRSIQFFRYATVEEVAKSAWWREQQSIRGRGPTVRQTQTSAVNVVQ